MPLRGNVIGLAHRGVGRPQVRPEMLNIGGLKKALAGAELGAGIALALLGTVRLCCFGGGPSGVSVLI